jgi:hypothetical protein
MSDNDLIRRGDALAVLRDEIDLARIAMPQCVPILAADMRAIAAIPAVDPLADPRVKALVEAKLEKVLNHIRKMQGYVQEYLEPGPYVAKHGNGGAFSEPHPHQDEAYAYFMRQQMREAVLNDLIHMLDGPEERATLAEIEGEKG